MNSERLAWNGRRVTANDIGVTRKGSIQTSLLLENCRLCIQEKKVHGMQIKENDTTDNSQALELIVKKMQVSWSEPKNDL